MSRYHPRAVLGVAGLCLVAVVPLAGCSDSSDESTATTTSEASVKTQPLSDFQAAANPICDRVSAALSDVVAPSTVPATLEDFDTGSAATLAAVEEDYTALAALDPPSGHEAEFETFATSLTGVIEQANQIQRLVDEGNDDTDALWLPQAQTDTLHGQAMDAAAVLGLEGCTSLAYSGGEE